MASFAPERVLLALLGSADRPELGALGALGQADWDRIAQIAETHRLGPQLHSLHRGNNLIPDPLRSTWSAAYRQSALTALAQQVDLKACCALLEGAGFAPIALKGSFLAHHAWHDPALRPMRDIDLLVAQDHVLDAFALLRASGYVLPVGSKLDLADHARFEQHMPVMQMPRGSWLELHMRISELDGRLEYATPQGDETAVIARAVMIDGLRYPAAEDMLGHVITHAVYGHRFDCGPLLLGDVHYLVARHRLDWDLFWRNAAAAGWAKGAALVFALVREYHGAAAVPAHAAEPSVDTAQLDLARDLIVQDWETKMFSRFAAAFVTGGFGYVWRRITGRVEREGEAAVTIDRARDGGRLRWAWQRGTSLLRDLADPRIRAQTRQLARYRRWLEG